MIKSSNNNMKHMIKYILMLCVVFSLLRCWSRNDKTSYDPKLIENIVEEMAVDYGTYGAEANVEATMYVQYQD